MICTWKLERQPISSALYCKIVKKKVPPGNCETFFLMHHSHRSTKIFKILVNYLGFN